MEGEERMEVTFREIHFVKHKMFYVYIQKEMEATCFWFIYM